jgi:Leucine-rich repeat (LRR) protein
LSLNGNRLQLLPTDLAALEKLNELDISNNLFRDIADLIIPLKSLPKLTHLMYSFKNDEEENIVKKELPRLERLNKKPLNNTALVNKKQKQSSSLMKLNEQDL